MPVMVAGPAAAGTWVTVSPPWRRAFETSRCPYTPTGCGMVSPWYRILMTVNADSMASHTYHLRHTMPFPLSIYDDAASPSTTGWGMV